MLREWNGKPDGAMVQRVTRASAGKSGALALSSRSRD
jgi:hypothetical protein